MKTLRKITTFSLVFYLLFSSPNAIANKHKPTQAEIDAAKKAEAQKKAVADAAAKTLNKAKSDLRQLTSIATQANDRFLKAKKELEIATTNLSNAIVAHQNALAAVGKAHDDIGRLAISAYTTGGSMSDLESLLNADGPQELIDRLETLNLLGKNNDTALKRFREAEILAKRMKIAADAAKKAQEVATAVVADSKLKADAARNEQQKEVNRLQSIQDKLAKDLASAKNVRVSLEQRRQLALLEESKAQTAVQIKVSTKVWKAGGPSGKATIRTSTAQRLLAVEFAKRQVLAKKPYVWGSEGPNSFDCSGLVYAAFRYAGLGWPNWDRLNAALYYKYTKQIPLSEMQPGDLIFYSYNGSIAAIHHMSIYAGNNMMWEARSTKSGLRYSNINSVDGMMPYVGRV
jgi:cell wall-associated NlpC family hydrolase